MESSTEVMVTHEIDPCCIQSLLEALRQVTDHRCKRGRRYEAAPVLTVMVLAKMAGEHTWSGIAQWVRLRAGWLQETVGLSKAPCANSYRYICEHIDAVELSAKVAMFLGEGKEEAVGPVCATAACPTAEAAEMRHLACDGKELRGSHRLVEGQEQAAQQVFGIYNVSAGYMEALVPIAGKGYEPAAFRQWLSQYVRNTTKTSDFFEFMNSFKYVSPGKQFTRDERNER